MQRNKASLLQPRRERGDCISLVSGTFWILPKLISGDAIQEFGGAVIQRDALNRTRASRQASERSSGCTTNQPWYWQCFVSTVDSVVWRRCVVAKTQCDCHYKGLNLTRSFQNFWGICTEIGLQFLELPGFSLIFFQQNLICERGWAECNLVTKRVTRWGCLSVVKRGLIVMETAAWNKEI